MVDLMPKKLLILEKLQQLLKSNWTSFLDSTQVLKQALLDVQNAKLKEVREKDAPLPRTKITITRFELTNKGAFEIWVEFTIQTSRGTAVGTHTYNLTLDGELQLQETHGVLFVTEN
jgi:hypothetical protein